MASNVPSALGNFWVSSPMNFVVQWLACDHFMTAAMKHAIDPESKAAEATDGYVGCV